MVSPVPNAAKNPPLSYADRARKAQRNGSTSAVPPLKPLAPVTTSAAGSPSSNGPKSAVFSPSPSATSNQPDKTSKNIARQPDPLTQTSKAPTPPQPNGESHTADVDPVAGPSSSTLKKSPAPSVVNVWSLRKEQLAARVPLQTSQPRPSDDPPLSKGAAASSIPADARPTAPNAKSTPAAPVGKQPLAQDVTLVASHDEDEDPWTVRPSRAPEAVRIPRLDASSWPEVGKAPVNGVSDAGDAVKEDRGKRDTQATGSRKSEKPKWVPMPAEELQAFVDAQRSSRPSTASRSRSQSQQRPQNRNQGSNITSGSARGSRVSQERSRRDRAFGSAPHSEAHSRAGSIHSSPRHPSGKPGPSSLRSSRAGSPGIHGPAMVPATDAPYTMHAHAAPFYPAQSHVTGPYPPPLPPYPAYNPAIAPYPMYAPYAPSSGPPYAYWAPPTHGQDSRHPYAVPPQAHSPATHNSSVVNDSRSDDTSPPTSIDPSPAAGSAEALVTKVDNASAGPSQGRPRVLSFGSITADGEVLPDAEPSEAAPAADASSTLGLSVGDLKISDVPEKTTPRNADSVVSSATAGIDGNDPSRRRTQSDQVASASPPRTRTTSAPEVSSTVEPDSSRDAIRPSASEPTWMFGTAERAVEEADPIPPSNTLAAPPTASGLPTGVASAIPPRLRLSPLSSAVNPEGLPPTPVPVSTSGLYASNSPITVSSSADGDEFQVRDFGYGMGRGKDGVPYLPSREDRGGRDRPYYGGRGASRPYEEGYRRGFGGRRGRGSARGFGRGGRQGRGDYRGASGQYRYYPREGDFEGEEAYTYGMPAPMDATVYYNVPPMHPGGYYGPGYDFYPPYAAPYLPPPTVSPQTTQPVAPTPAPITRLTFPLDHLRYYLLGQLEYYLSEDNLARDIYLRKRMDSRGWIPTSLLASFPRVLALTAPTGMPPEVHLRLIKDVLVLSSLVEVKTEWVRPHQWERFKLPDAAPSVVDAEGATTEDRAPENFDMEQYIAANGPQVAEAAAQPVDAAPEAPQESDGAAVATVHEPEVEHGEGEEEDTDDDDVEFVLGKDANGTWASERKVAAGAS